MTNKVIKNHSKENFTNNLTKFFPKYLRTIALFFKGDFRILIRNKSILSASSFLITSLALCAIIIEITWSNDPMLSDQIQSILIFSNSLFVLTFFWVILYVSMQNVFINIPIIALSFIFKFNFRTKRIVSSSLYTFSIMSLLLVLFIVCETLFLFFVGEVYFSIYQFFSWTLLIIITLFCFVRSMKFFGISYGISGYKFFLLSFLLFGMPTLLISTLSSQESRARWILAFNPINNFPLQRFYSPSSAMAPTLPVGARLLANKWISFDQIDYGDVVVFKHPKKDEILWVKRVVGLPEDRIQLRNGELYINKNKMHRLKIKDYKDEHRSSNQYIQTLLNGKKFKITEIIGDNGIADNTAEFKVPEGHFFVMGDNRDNSNDSRFGSVGFIPITNFVGKAYFVTYPLGIGQL